MLVHGVYVQGTYSMLVHGVCVQGTYSMLVHGVCVQGTYSMLVHGVYVVYSILLHVSKFVSRSSLLPVF